MFWFGQLVSHFPGSMTSLENKVPHDDSEMVCVYIAYVLILCISTKNILAHHSTAKHITAKHITSQQSTSHHITSHHITSHHITSHHITSHLISSHLISSHHISSHHISSHLITPQHITSPHAQVNSQHADLSLLIWYPTCKSYIYNRNN